MDKVFAQFISTVLGRNVVAGFILVLCVAVAVLFYEVVDQSRRMQAMQDAFRAEIVQTQIDCAKEIDRLNQRHLNTLNEFIEKLQKLNKKK